MICYLACDQPDTCLALRSGCVPLPLNMFWFFWPVVALYYTSQVKTCNGILIAQTLALAILHLLALAGIVIYSLWPLLLPFLHRHNILRHPGLAAMESFRRVPFASANQPDEIAETVVGRQAQLPVDIQRTREFNQWETLDQEFGKDFLDWLQAGVATARSFKG